MIKRESKKILTELSREFPVVTITGPRQCGKTTLAISTFPKKPYINLENPETCFLAENDPINLLNQYPNGCIIDEIQRVPQISSYIQTIVDKKNVTGFYILTGSNQFEYLHTISQSLAGRTGIIKLLPFSYKEIYSRKIININDVLFTGFYPRIFDKKIKPKHFYSSYFMTYLERDIRNISKIHNLSLFQKFITLCAGRTAQILNKNNLANECGIAHTTIEGWLSMLEASFIIYRLIPYYSNLNKRIVKSPKMYFLDTGLLTYLLNIEKPSQLNTHPLRGEIFETFVVSELLKKRWHNGEKENFYYFRDNNGNEVDIIIDTASGPVPVEIKSGQTVHNIFFKGLNYFGKLITNDKSRTQNGLIIGKNIFNRYKNTIISGYNTVYNLYDELISPA